MTNSKKDGIYEPNSIDRTSMMIVPESRTILPNFLLSFIPSFMVNPTANMKMGVPTES